MCGKCDYCVAKDELFVDIPICPSTTINTKEMTALKCAIEHSRVSDEEWLKTKQGYMKKSDWKWITGKI
jgi:hypothetical protein